MLERLFTCLAKKNRHSNSLAIVFTYDTSTIVCAGVLGNYTMSKVKVKYHVSVKISYKKNMLLSMNFIDNYYKLV